MASLAAASSTGASTDKESKPRLNIPVGNDEDKNGDAHLQPPNPLDTPADAVTANPRKAHSVPLGRRPRASVPPIVTEGFSSPTNSKQDMKKLAMKRRGSLQAFGSPNYMVATETDHFAPQADTPFAEALELTIGAEGEKKFKKRMKKRLLGYKGHLKNDSAELKSQKKKEKRRKKKEAKGKAVKKADVIGREHEMYALTYGMMIGVQVSVGRQFDSQTIASRDSPVNTPSSRERSGSGLSANGADEDPEGADNDGSVARLRQHNTSTRLNLDMASKRLTMKDFMTVEKYVFPLSGNAFTGKAQNVKFKFKDYAPLCFRHLRNIWKVDPADYLLSVCGNTGFIKFLSNSKSGQYFFYTNDYKYMIKTLTDDECKFLRRILPYLVKHMIEYPDSMINRYYGLHRVKMPHISRRLHFVVMNNIFNTPLDIHTKYDLKGATYKGRYTSHSDIQAKPGTIRKDLNWLGFDDALKGPVSGLAQKLKLGTRERRDAFLDQIHADAIFLSKMGIMDYSLLVGLHGRDPITVPGFSIGREKNVEKATARKQMGEQVVVSGDEGLHSGNDSGDGMAYENQSSGHDDDYDEEKMPGADSDEYACLPVFNQEWGGYEGKDIHGENNNEIYYFGIIDILQQYNMIKRGENFFKSVLLNMGEKISSMPPFKYAERFIKFIRESTEPYDSSGSGSDVA